MWKQIADIPVPQIKEGFVPVPFERSCERSVKQSAEIPVLQMEAIQIVSHGFIQDRIVQQCFDFHVPQIIEEFVDIALYPYTGKVFQVEMHHQRGDQVTM